MDILSIFLCVALSDFQLRWKIFTEAHISGVAIKENMGKQELRKREKIPTERPWRPSPCIDFSTTACERCSLNQWQALTLKKAGKAMARGGQKWKVGEWRNGGNEEEEDRKNHFRPPGLYHLLYTIFTVKIQPTAGPYGAHAHTHTHYTHRAPSLLSYPLTCVEIFVVFFLEFSFSSSSSSLSSFLSSFARKRHAEVDMGHVRDTHIHLCRRTHIDSDGPEVGCHYTTA